MREKELRIALVCFGGVSLAVYMHGISKEILKLVRASSALHGIPDRAARAGARSIRSATSRPRPGLRHRGGLFRAAARDRPPRRTARDRRHHRGRVRRRHQRHHAGARARARSADGGAARPVARQCRRRGPAGARRARRHLEQVVPAAVPLGRRQVRQVQHVPGPGGPPETLAASCARAGSSRRSTGASWRR